MITLAQDLDFYLALYGKDEGQALQALFRARPDATAREITAALDARAAEARHDAERYPLTTRFLAELSPCK